MRDGMKTLTLRLSGIVLAALLSAPAVADTANEPWKRDDLALVIDAYEYNPIDWDSLSKDERVAGFINKASDGLPPTYRCKGEGIEYDHCRLAWKRYSVTKELYHTRRMMAKQLGYVWGAYHLGRPGNPEDQADHFLQFAEPQDDELIAIDIEDNDPEKFMSLADAEIFARRIKARTGRWPVLYTNGSTSEYIANHAGDYPILSRMQIWYARYRNEIEGVFPLGNWQNYALWQFASHVNCKGKDSCPYRPAGTAEDIDVNVAPMNKLALQRVWPFGELLPQTVPDEIIIAETDSDEPTGEEAETVATKTTDQAVDLASADADLVNIPLPMRSPRDPASAETATTAIADASSASEDDLADVAVAMAPEAPASEMMAFASRPGLKRTASQALARFAAGKGVTPSYAKTVPASASPVSTFRPEASSVPAEKTTVAAMPTTDPVHFGVAFANHPLRRADRLSDKAQTAVAGTVLAATEAKPEKSHAETIAAKSIAQASILSAQTMAPRAVAGKEMAAKRASEPQENSGFLERIKAIIDNTPDRLFFD